MTTAEVDHLLVETAQGVTTVTLNRPESLNALTSGMVRDLLALLRRLERDPATRAVIVRGAGRGFCAGADLGHLAAEVGSRDGSAPPDPAEVHAFLEQDSAPLAKMLLAFPKPLVAAVGGPCAGAGASIALACDFLVAASDAVFSFAFINRGLVPDYGATWLLPRLVGLRTARELCLLGDRFDAARGEALGLVWRVVDREELDAQSQDLATRLAEGPAMAQALTKRLLHSAFDRDHGAAVDDELTAQTLCFTSGDALEGMAAFLARRPPRFAGAPETSAARSRATTIRPDRDRNAEGRPENARPRDRFGRPLPRGAVDELGDREEPDDVVSTVEAALERAVELFDAQRFFEAHEFLEWIWKAEATEAADRDFWKGVTQVAVGCCHTQRGNGEGAVTLLERATSYMDGYPTPHHGVDTAALCEAARRLADEVRASGATPDRRFPAFPRA